MKRFSFIALVFLAGALLVNGCADLSETPELIPEEERRQLATQEFEDALITQTNDGETSFVLTAPFVERYDFQKQAKLSGGIEVTFYKGGQPSSHLTAERGEVLRDGNELFAEGNVVVDTDSGMVIYTPRLKWTESDGMIRSDTIVTIVTQWDSLHGTGLIASEDLQYRRILHPTGVSRRNVKKTKTESSD
ncbi:LPS export ABC transporter periplasmic protein LptC [bacterium]|nr:LPS export ABC transporter periplasmic protein LptC [bacterium]